MVIQMIEYLPVRRKNWITYFEEFYRGHNVKFDEEYEEILQFYNKKKIKIVKNKDVEKV